MIYSSKAIDEDDDHNVGGFDVMVAVVMIVMMVAMIRTTSTN